MLSKEKMIDMQEVVDDCKSFSGMTFSGNHYKVSQFQKAPMLLGEAVDEILSLREQLEAVQKERGDLYTKLNNARKENDVLLESRYRLDRLREIKPVLFALISKSTGNVIEVSKSLSDIEYLAPHTGCSVIPLFTAAKPAEDK